MKSSEIPITEEKLGIVFRYSRANIYSYHSLMGALEISPLVSDIPIFFPKPEELLPEINRLLNVEHFTHLLICISVSTFQLQDVLLLLENLKLHPKNNQMTVVVGGPHPSAKPGDLLYKGTDIAVVGEGEKTFQELVLALRNKNTISQLKGIAFLDKEKNIQIQPRNEPINLNEYPPFAPDRELYSAIEITRGCKFGCTYCQVPSLFGKSVRYRSPENIIKWGKFLLSKRDIWDFRFISPNAFGYGSKKSSEPNVKKLTKMLSGLHNLKAKNRKRIFFGTFPSEVRPESVTEETLRITREFCDNDNLTMGAQSGSSKILASIRRGHTVEQVLDAVELASKYNFTMNVDFILGFPDETEEDQFETISLCKELIAKKSKIHMHYLIPLPGTKYENIKPKSISPEILKIIRRWSNDGIIFGSWQHQYEKVTNQITIKE
ncbi:MAG: TIGR04013 family B12-binding domain/radical SAM domain-containing protein [Asgard group archaeon]|nr:TIGR04013 family B12-binding domain/radical SAM domain-containing protein [Asgard group archaeon]